MSNEHNKPRFEIVGDSIEGPGGRITALGRTLTRAEIDQAVSHAAQPVSEQVPGIESPFNACMHKAYCLSLKAQPVGEPVAKVADLFHAVRDRLVAQGADLYDLLYTTPQPSPERVPMTHEAQLQWRFIRDRLNTISMYQDSIGKFVEWFEAHHRITTPSNQPTSTE